MIYRGPGFLGLRMIWLLPHLLTPLPTASCLFFSLAVHRRSRFLTWGGGGGLSSINHSILYVVRAIFAIIANFEDYGAHNDSKNEKYLPQADLRKRFRNYHIWIIVVPFCTDPIGDCTHRPRILSLPLFCRSYTCGMMWGCWSAQNNWHLLVTPQPSALFVPRLIHSDFRSLAGTGGKGLKVFDLTSYHCKKCKIQKNLNFTQNYLKIMYLFFQITRWCRDTYWLFWCKLRFLKCL
jgi:hypothetical protein